ncbi:MAG: O-fucosyltransferase family protein, partial [Arenicellales bacterium]
MSRFVNYWRNEISAKVTAAPPLFGEPDANKYITFELDCGGLNNIRMQFEYISVIAAITGRTLVLPPADAWYLINRGPISREGDLGGVSHHSDFFDIEALRAWIPVVSAEQFIRKEGANLRIPEEFQSVDRSLNTSERSDSKRALRSAWVKWQSQQFQQLYWNPLNNVVFYPDLSAVFEGSQAPDDGFMDGRTPVTIDRYLNDEKVLHFSCNVERGQRQLGLISKAFAFPDSSYQAWIWRMLRDGLRFSPSIFKWSKAFIDLLGLNQYSSLHLRRNDIQFIEARAAPEITSETISQLLDHEEPIYIATDEKDEEFFKNIERQRTVFRYADLASMMRNKTGQNDVPNKFIGCVEQLICAGGRRFIRTPHSSFSMYISRIRGYIDAPDLAVYSHTEPYKIGNRDQGFIRRSLAGRSYMQEDPAIWEQADISMPIYSVVCTDTSSYAHWQCELLEYSWKQVAQPGELIRLVSCREDDPFPSHRYCKTIPTNYTNEHPVTGDKYVPYNRLYSFREWLANKPTSGTVLILDPDCVFRDRLPLTVSPGSPIGQRWRGFAMSERWRDPVTRYSSANPEQVQA